MKNLFIEKIEIRTSKDEDVVPYVQEVDIDKTYLLNYQTFLPILKNILMPQLSLRCVN